MDIEDSFPAMPVPNSGDWLSEHEEEGQTVEQFRKCKHARPTTSFVSSFFFYQRKSFHFVYRRNIICIQPIGDFNTIRYNDYFSYI